MNSDMLCFSVLEYAAWAPGLETRQAWHAWASHPVFPENISEPKLSAVPPLLRRRTDLLGKMALESACQCLSQPENVPVVFASRHGEVARSAKMLSGLAQHEPMSPTAFSLSVHNAVAGLFSIAFSSTANNIAIASKEDIVENALFEACSLLADGEKKVLLVVYNNALPTQLSQFEDQPELPYSWAWLIEKPGKNAISLARTESEETNATGYALPQELEIFRFFLSDAKRHVIQGRRQAWLWSRHD